jgi:hypothetical protein
MTVEKSIITRGKLGVLVQWKGPTAAETSWMALEEFRKLYPSFQLTDELIVQEGRDVMVGITYKWRGNQSAATAEEQNDATACSLRVPNKEDKPISCYPLAGFVSE